MKTIRTIINDRNEEFQLPPGTVLLDVLRNDLKLKGTKEGCREGDCGSCIVLRGTHVNGYIDYRIVNSCMFPLGEAENSHIVTVEGLNGTELSPFQQAMVDENASQCGFCTPGFVVSMAGYFLHAKTLNVQDAVAFLSGNICRCTGYTSIIRAMEKALSLFNAHEFTDSYGKDRVPFLIQHQFLPEYFQGIHNLLLKQGHVSKQDMTGKLVLGGGTDLYVQKEDEVVDSDVFLISNDQTYKGISLENDKCVIGAATTVTELEESDIFCNIIPDFPAFVRLISGVSIRNRATIGGNIVNASPIGDLSIIFLVLNATLVLEKNNKTREVPLRDFFKSYKQLDLLPGEIVHSLSFPVPREQSKICFEKVSRRTHLDIASVNTAMLIYQDNNIVQEFHLSAGGVAPVPLYLKTASEFLRGKTLSHENIDKTISIAVDEISPISDVRGSASYKKLLLRQLLISHFSSL
jgi:xanthine dehydrogenase small subunit